MLIAVDLSRMGIRMNNGSGRSGEAVWGSINPLIDLWPQLPEPQAWLWVGTGRRRAIAVIHISRPNRNSIRIRWVRGYMNALACYGTQGMLQDRSMCVETPYYKSYRQRTPKKLTLKDFSLKGFLPWKVCCATTSLDCQNLSRFLSHQYIKSSPEKLE